jgi:hypothetical protein
MAVLTVQLVSRTGLLPTYAAVSAGGDSVPNNGRVLLHVKNGNASPTNVTVDSIQACNQGNDHDVVVTVPNASERIIGPFPVARFGRNLAVTYTVSATVTIAVLDPNQ